MKKKLMMMVAAVAAVFGAWAETETFGGYTWTYQINGDTAEIYGTGYPYYMPDISPSPTGAVTIPSTLGGKPVTSIGSEAFYNCSGLTSVTIPNSVTSIGERAFYGCSGLTSVTIPNSVTSIEFHAFDGCSGLMSISVGSGNVNYKSVNGLLLSKDGKTLIQGVNGDVNIPDSVTSIGSEAFHGCSGLTSVTIPDSVTSIGVQAFRGCSGLTSVTIPDSVTSIGDYAFYGCSGLTSVTIPDSVTSIGEGAFYGCSGLTSVTIPDGVTSIGEYAFVGCSSLMSFVVAGENPAYKSVSGLLLTKDGETLVAGVNGNVTIPDSVTSIGYAAFRGCSGLTSVTIPDSVTIIEWVAFSGCSGLTKIHVAKGDTARVKGLLSRDSGCGVDGITFLEDVEPGTDPTPDIDPVPTPSPTPTPTPEPTPEPSPTPEPMPTPEPTPEPAPTPEPTPTPEPEPVVVPDLYDETEIAGAVPATAASVYDGYLVDAKGNVAGSIQVKVGKSKAGLAAVKATVVVGAAKASLKAESGGKVAIAEDGPTTMRLVGGESCEVTLGAEGLSGSYGSYLIDGARNFFLSKDKGELGAANDVLSKWLGPVSVVWNGGSVNVSIAKKGKAKVKGTLANGTKVSAKSVFLVGEEWCAVPVAAPKAKLTFTLWLSRDGHTAVVEGLGDGAIAGKPRALKSSAKFQVGKTAALWTSISGTVLTDYIPDGFNVASNGGKWVLPKAGKVVYKDGAVDGAKLGDNPSGLKLTYKAKDGSFKGSFKVYAVNGGKLKATTVNVAGVVINGVGYGTATIKKVGSVPVKVE